MKEQTLEEKLKYPYGFFFKRDGIYYIKNYDYHIAIAFIDGKWIQVDNYDEIYIDHGYEEVNEKVAKDVLKDSLPDVGIFKRIDVEGRSRYLNKIKELSKTTPRKLLGFISDSNRASLVASDDEDDTRYAALYKYFQETGYFMSGEEYQNLGMEPIFDDYTFYSFSRRGWGFFMALLKEKLNRYDYAMFTESILMEEEGFAAKYPPCGPLNGVRTNNKISVNNDVFSHIEYGDKYHILFKEISDEYIWPDEDLFIENLDSGESTFLSLAKLQIVNSEEEVEHFLSLLKDEGSDYILLNEKFMNEHKFPMLLVALV